METTAVEKTPNGGLKSKKGVIACIVGVVLLLALGVSLFIGDGGTPIEKYKQAEIERLSQEVASWPSTKPDLIKQIESRHLTVTVKKVELCFLDVKTVDGGSVVYRDRSNIAEQEMHVRFWWDGIIETDGHTTLGFQFDKTGKVVRTWTVESTAVIDLDDPDFWVSVGSVLGSMIFSD